MRGAPGELNVPCGFAENAVPLFTPHGSSHKSAPEEIEIMKKNTLWLNVTAVGMAFAAAAMAYPSITLSTRSYVSNVGSDGNTCTLIRPCATFQGALAKTAAGGEIDVLNSGEYGSVSIDHSITIDGQGSLATLTYVSGEAPCAVVCISAGATDHVALRNLSISGGTQGVSDGAAGIEIGTAAGVTLENVSISGLSEGVYDGGVGLFLIQDTRITDCTATGLNILGPATVLRDVVISMPSGSGIYANGSGVVVDVYRSTISGGGVLSERYATVNLKDSSVENAATGVHSSSATISLNNTAVQNNGTGISTSGGAIVSYGNNQISGNGTNGSPTSTVSLH
jgi:hypothetical protein